MSLRCRASAASRSGHGGQMIVRPADRVQFVMVRSVEHAVVLVFPRRFNPDVKLIVQVSETSGNPLGQAEQVGAGIPVRVAVGIEHVERVAVPMGRRIAVHARNEDLGGVAEGHRGQRGVHRKQVGGSRRRRCALLGAQEEGRRQERRRQDCQEIRMPAHGFLSSRRQGGSGSGASTFETQSQALIARS